MRLKIILSILIISLLTGCQKSFITKTGFWMGTVVDITIDTKNAGLVPEIQKSIKKIEGQINDIANNINELKINVPLKLDNPGLYLAKNGEFFKKISGGKFDIAVFTLSSLYGFPEGPYKIPEKHLVEESLAKIGGNRFIFSDNLISKTEEVKIDMGAYAKGFIVDNISAIITSLGVDDFIFNAGGDLFASGSKNGKPWKIAIKHPEESNGILSIIGLKDMAVATSGNYERFFEHEGKRYIHIFDAKTGENANNYKSISVIAKKAEKADGFATVFFLMTVPEISELCKKEGLPVLIYTLDNRTEKLCGWEDFEIR